METLMLAGILIVLVAVNLVSLYLQWRKVQSSENRLALEQIHKKILSGEAKKRMAIDAIKELYKSHPELKEPTRAAIEIALEAAVYWLKKSGMTT